MRMDWMQYHPRTGLPTLWAKEKQKPHTLWSFNCKTGAAEFFAIQPVHQMIDVHANCQGPGNTIDSSEEKFSLKTICSFIIPTRSSLNGRHRPLPLRLYHTYSRGLRMASRYTLWAFTGKNWEGIPIILFVSTNKKYQTHKIFKGNRQFSALKVIFEIVIFNQQLDFWRFILQPSCSVRSPVKFGKHFSCSLLKNYYLRYNGLCPHPRLFSDRLSTTRNSYCFIRTPSNENPCGILVFQWVGRRGNRWQEPIFYTNSTRSQGPTTIATHRSSQFELSSVRCRWRNRSRGQKFGCCL